MNACATLSSLSLPGAMPVNRPMVLIDGGVEPDVVVERVEQHGPLDTRRAVMRWSSPTPDAGQWIVAQPRRLMDGGVKWHVWAVGSQPRRMEEQRLELVDRWTDLLAKPIAAIAVDRNGGLVQESVGRLALTRSAVRYDVAGRSVHVLQRDGSPWSVAEALASLAAFAGVGLNLRGLSGAAASALLVAPVDLARSLGEALMRILEPHGLFIERQIELDGHTLIERAAVRPHAHARRVRLRWAGPGAKLGDVLRVTREKSASGSRLWIAETSGPVVESTFALVGGWDPALEGEADDEYDRGASSDFPRYANVYRHWVLNEDGAYSASPYLRGAAYDLEDLFDQGPMPPVALALQSCVTLDDAGKRREAIVEYSTDSGTSWAIWPGRVRLLRDRAGIYLEDATLAAGYLSAAKAGTARLRVTAALGSPVPVRARRWRGNPFAGVRPPLRLDASGLFAFRKVHADSIHSAAVQDGSLEADLGDRESDMLRWLVDRMWRDEVTLASRDGEAVLKLIGDGVVRVGDRLFEAGGLGRDLMEQAQTLRDDGGLVTKVVEEYDAAVMTIALRY